MRFLVDQNLSSRLAELLRGAGHDAIHVSEIGLSRASDEVILSRAAAESRVLLSGDTDFATLLATEHRRRPSVILFRRERPRRAEAQATLILNHLEPVATALDEGAIVVIEEPAFAYAGCRSSPTTKPDTRVMARLWRARVHPLLFVAVWITH